MATLEQTSPNPDRLRTERLILVIRMKMIAKVQVVLEVVAAVVVVLEVVLEAVVMAQPSRHARHKTPVEGHHRVRMP